MINISPCDTCFDPTNGVWKVALPNATSIKGYAAKTRIKIFVAPAMW